MYFDSTYILVLIGALIGAIASSNVNRTFSKYSTVGNSRGLTGREAAAMILRGAGIDDVKIDRISGDLTDHYAPGEKVLRLSDSVYDSQSVAALGVAAHECGHAIQHHVGYGPLTIRNAAVPVCKIGSTISWPLILAGIVLGATGLAKIGVLLFCAVVFFQLITLPVEFNASNRAMAILEESNMLSGGELVGARKVLKAAALTYVAALVSSVLQLLRLVLIVNRNKRK